MKRVVYVVLLGAFVSLKTFAVPTTGRSWNFVNVNLNISKHWSWILNPGVRYEFSRTDGDAKGVYMVELFTGPVYITKYHNIKIAVPIQYYYMGFPTKKGYYYNHSIDLRPSFKYKIGKFMLYNKFVFHNTFYATIYSNPDQRSGYSLMLKYFFGIQYFVNKSLSLLLTEDPIWGIIENKNVKSMTGIGFTEYGFDINRIFAGVSYKLSKSTYIVPQYCFELKYKKNKEGHKELVEKEHYVFLSLNYRMKI